MSRWYTNVPSTLGAKAEAIKATLTNAKEKGYEDLHLFSDSPMLINLLNNGAEHNDLFGVLYDIRDLASSFRLISFSYIPRLSNVEADALAKRVLYLATLNKGIKSSTKYIYV